MSSTLERLMSWYQAHCDGYWEHDYGISIDSCDNPGWWVKVDLTGTSLRDIDFPQVTRGETDSLDPAPPWLHCYVEDGVFHGLGDATTLEEILEIFMNWVGDEVPESKPD